MRAIVLIFGLVVAMHSQGFAAEDTETSLSCASSDQKVKMISRVRDNSMQIGLSINKKQFQYNDGQSIKVLQFTNGETVVRDWNTGRAVLTFKEVPLSRSDRGSEKKIAISQSEHFEVGKGPLTPTALVFLQCQVVVTKSANSRFFAQAN